MRPIDKVEGQQGERAGGKLSYFTSVKMEGEMELVLFSMIR